MLYLKFLFSLTSIHIIYAGFIQDKLLTRVEPHLERLDGQCRGRNVTQQTFFQGVSVESTKIIIQNYTLIVKEGGLKKLMGTIIINRCRFKENLDTCEQYFKHSNIDFCKAIDPDNFLSKNSPFFVPFEPPVKCPSKKGVYRAYNVTLDLAPFLFFKLDGWYWKSTFELYTEYNRMVFCMVIDGYVIKSKSK